MYTRDALNSVCLAENVPGDLWQYAHCPVFNQNTQELYTGSRDLVTNGTPHSFQACRRCKARVFQEMSDGPIFTKRQEHGHVAPPLIN
jgi:hypothetical protein